MTCLPSGLLGHIGNVDDACTLGRSVVNSSWISFNSTVVLESSLLSKSSCSSASSADSKSVSVLCRAGGLTVSGEHTSGGVSGVWVLTTNMVFTESLMLVSGYTCTLTSIEV